MTKDVNESVIKSARNLPGVATTIATIMSPYDVLNTGKLVVDKAALEKIEEVYA
ncbi:MAG: 50S ribosomal protein L4 [Oscillospiraceae bacterium]